MLIWLPCLLALFVGLVGVANLWLARVELENALEAAALAAVKQWGEAGGGDTVVAASPSTGPSASPGPGPSPQPPPGSTTPPTPSPAPPAAGTERLGKSLYCPRVIFLPNGFKASPLDGSILRKPGLFNW
ncbi:MAG: hypothetical protein K6T59_13295 [Bryobacteraceae bacterium]|nr:hypothetical protein [Bryobacteraceae bacterium]